MSYPYFLSYIVQMKDESYLSSQVLDLKNEVRTKRHLRAVEKKLQKELDVPDAEVCILDMRNLAGFTNVTNESNIRYFVTYGAGSPVKVGSTVVEYHPIPNSASDLTQLEMLVRKQEGFQDSEMVRVITFHPLKVEFKPGGEAA